MPKFVLAYHGSKKFDTPEAGQAHMAAWNAWQDSLGSALGESMPVGMSKTVSKTGVEDNGGANPLSGITILEADSMEGAIKMAQDCPHVNVGTIEVAEMFQM